MSHPEHPSCPFCPENGKVAILHETTTWFIVKAVVDDKPAPGAWLVVPKKHVQDLHDIPGNWMRHVWFLARKLNKEVDNLSINLTPDGGRQIEHCHIWLIQRQPGDPSLGLHGLLKERRREIFWGPR